MALKDCLWLQQAEELQSTNGELNAALGAKIAQVAEVQKENARLEQLNAKLVHVHAAPEQADQAAETRQLLRYVLHCSCNQPPPEICLLPSAEHVSLLYLCGGRCC